jgi:enamine deaminase RidA (YjgF/YER057c/UK114 family)
LEKRRNISSGTVWENVVGYSRAVRVGQVVEVAGTTATQNGQPVGEDDPYTQTRVILTIIEQALRQAGASLADVVRTRIFVTDIRRWEEVGRAHGEFFRDIRPVTTMVEVKSLIHPSLLVEIEATAVIP